MTYTRVYNYIKFFRAVHVDMNLFRAVKSDDFLYIRSTILLLFFVVLHNMRAGQ